MSENVWLNDNESKTKIFKVYITYVIYITYVVFK